LIVLWGTGFGPTLNPPIAAGYLVTQAAQFASAVRVFIGGVEAEVLWAGRSGAGLDQLNVRVPVALPDGDYAVSAEIAGTRTQENLFLTVAR
jgi:uncharacterized protein (TIGR03437 family)